MSDTKCVELPCGRVVEMSDFEASLVTIPADACFEYCPITGDYVDVLSCDAYKMAREAEEEPAPTHEERITALEETVKRLEESIRKTAMQSYINSGEYEP